MNPTRRCLVISSLAAATLALSACTGVYSVSADVSSYGSWPADRAPQSFAFERLPSQQNSQRQDQLEESASAALEKAGFQPAADPGSADITVSLGARLSATEYAPWDDPLWFRWRGAWGPRVVAGGGWRGHPRFGYGVGYGWGGYPVDTRYEHEVAVLMRDRATGQAVYEAHASYESITPGNQAVLSAMFQAALSDFPRAEPKPHQIVVQGVR